MEPSDENISSLLAMGFQDIGQIQRALRLADNDLSEAVSILTGEDNREGFHSSDPGGDIEMKDAQYRQGEKESMPGLVEMDQSVKHKQSPPSYDEAVSTTQDDLDANTENMDIPLDSIPDEFPTTHLYELEERIFTENWSIPYRKNESLGKCLLGAIKVTQRGEAEKDANCKRFMDRALPECFQKLLTSDAVRRWNSETLEGVYNMLRLFMDLAAARLHFEPVPVKLLSVLSQAFDPDSEYHFKNRGKRWDRAYFEDIYGFQKCPAVSPTFSVGRDPFGWLVNLINRFGLKNGLDAICDRIEKSEGLTAPILASLLQPLGVCAAYLNPEVAGYKLGSAADKAVMYVKDLKDSDIKEKEIGKVFDLLRTLKLLCQVLWKDKLSYLDELHLGTLLNMLKSAHYNARMNSLKEICKLIKESEKIHLNRTAIAQDALIHWLLENKVLSIAFQSSLHQHQYCEKLKKVVEFVGARLSNDELTTIWTMQSGKHNTVVDNIHTIIASAAQSFTSDQLEHLISLLQQSWNSEDEKAREKLLMLIGRIGREVNDSKAVAKLLEVVWGLSHVDSLPTHLINQAVQSHLDILTLSQYVTDQVRNLYIEKCIQDIRDGRWVVPAIRHLQSNLEAMLKKPYSKSHKSMLQDLQKQTDVIKLVTVSLIRSHQQAVESPGQLDGDTIIDNQYAYGETVVTHLRFIAYLLQDGALYLSFTRVKDIWDCLMLDENNCKGDYETAFEWFTDGVTDLEHETQANLFTTRMLKVDVFKISAKGFKCFRVYFENVNTYEHKIKRTGQTLLVEKQDLTGINYLWQLLLATPDDDIAEESMQYLIQLSYTSLSPRLKKADAVSMHRRFIAECNKRLESLLAQLGICSGGVVQEQKQAQKQRKTSVKSMGRETILLGVKRLLLLAYYYITTVEENFPMPRRFPAHGTCYRGFPVTLNINHEATKTEIELQSHSNETLSSLRRRIAKHLLTSPESVILSLADKALTNNKDQKLLHQLNLQSGQTISVKTISTVNGASGSSASSAPEDEGLKPSSLLEREKGLPSYLMALEFKVFERLYELALLEESGVTDALRSLLQLLPTDTSVLNAFDVFSYQDSIPESPKPLKDGSNLSSVFDEYFKLSGPKMSPFRLLYNLQVLSSKLIPTEEKETPSAFRENFLNAGGLSLVLNILQPDAMPTSVAYELRQSCYFVCLQLARSLLHGETSQPVILSFASPVKTVGASSTGMATTATPDAPMGSTMATSTPIKLLESPHKNQSASVASSWPGAGSASPLSLSMMSSSPGSSAGVTPDNASEPKRPRAGSLIDSVAPSARLVVEMMNRDDYAETIACLVRVAWAAAAGQLQLFTFRQNRNDESEKSPASLRSGICLTRNDISPMDALLSQNAIELLVMCLQLRPNLMNVFYYLPNVNEFIIDLLVGSSSMQVRTAAMTQLTILSETEISEPKVQQARDFLVRTLFKAPVPLWNSSTYIRANYRIHSQCTPYFDLLCNLLRNLPKSDQENLKVKPSKLLEDEIGWLSSSGADPALLLGHLKLIKTLFTCEGVDKRALGKEYIKTLLDDFLFAASKFVQRNQTIANEVLLESSASCTSKECRIAAFEIFVTLAEGCAENLCDIVTQLISKHHSQLSTSKEWEFQPPVAARPSRGFVGLQNGGATCYMNSVIQQLYMQPGIQEALLKVDESTSNDTNGVFYQMQTIFGHLLEGKMQYYRPETFWKCFKLWGQHVNVREQQDAFEFFTCITDQLDEQLKKFGHEEIFKKTFCGMFSDQKICKECPHRYEREQEFHSIPVTVKCRTLESSLEQYMTDEIMEGDNAYYCEKCRENRTTIKRLCIKSLPQVLAIQLKRFWYDWEAGRPIKFDDSFQFPWILDVQPFTSQGMSKNETKSTNGSDNNLSGRDSSSDQCFYELVGILVHIGQANAGHYYSFIKNRTNTGHAKRWYKFNDTTVEEFEMTDANLENECFGGSYKVSRQDKNSQYPENRIRNWNAYMLFYEAIDKTFVSNLPRTGSRELLREELQELRRSVPSSPTSSTSSGPPSPGRTDSLSQLSALIRRGEKRGIFNDKIPPSIRRLVLEDNLQFMQNRDVYNEDYFQFVYDLCSCNLDDIGDPSDQAQKNIALCSFQLAAQFLFNTYFRTTKTLRMDFQVWYQALDKLLRMSPESCLWLLNLLAGDRAKEYLGPYLVECPDKEIRTGFCDLLISVFDCSLASTDSCFDPLIQKVIGQLIDLVDTNVISNCRQSNQYFEFFRKYSCLGLTALKSLYSKEIFKKFIYFLLGPSTHRRDQRYVRRWSSAQAQEFGHLHLTLINLIVHTATKQQLDSDVSGSDMQTCDYPSKKEELVTMPLEIEETIYGDDGERYISECLYACIEIPNLTKPMAEMILHCCFCNEQISKRFIRQSQILLESVQPNDLKNVLQVISDVLCMEDPLQSFRVNLVVDGCKEEKITGILSIVKNSYISDPRRSYQCVKLLVNLAQKCSLAKGYLLQSPSRWQWSVDWLKKKMNEYYWTAQPHVSNESHINKSFQRTVSAQYTLAEATALLIEIEKQEASSKNSMSNPASASTQPNLFEAPVEDWDKESTSK